MARGAAKRPETPEEMYQRMLADGEVIQMYHKSKGVRYIANTEKGIRVARMCGFVDVEYEEETVKRPVVKAAEPKAAKPEAPKSKASGKGGE